MTIVGIGALLWSTIGLLRGRPAITAAALGFCAGVPASAGIALGTFAVPVFPCVALVAGVQWFAMRRRPLVSDAPRLGALLAFGAWSLAVTAIGPWAFAGTPVLLPGAGIDEQVHAPSALGFAVSNLSQTLYLVTALLGVLFLTRSGTARIALVTAACTGIGLSTVRSVVRSVADPFAPLLDTLPVGYASPRDPRWRGVFAEPSEMATFALAVVALAAAAAVTARTRGHRLGWSVLLVTAAVDLVASGSGTAAVAGLVVAAVGTIVVAVRFLLDGGKGTPWIVLGGIAVAGVAVAYGSDALAPVLSVIDAKVGSQSYSARTAADDIGLAALVDTRGFGVGLGSNRSSSFAVTLLATTGVVGTGLFVVVVLTAVRQGLRAHAVPAIAGLLAILVAKALATPDLSTPLLWVLLAGCLSAAAPSSRRVDTPLVELPALARQPA